MFWCVIFWEFAFFSLFFLKFCSSGPYSLLSQPLLKAAGIATTEQYGMCYMKNQFYSLAFHATYNDAIPNFSRLKLLILKNK